MSVRGVVPIIGNVAAQERIARKELYSSHSACSWKKLATFSPAFSECSVTRPQKTYIHHFLFNFYRKSVQEGNI